MSEILQRWVVSRKLGPVRQAGVAVLGIGVAAFARLLLTAILGFALPFLTFLPAILVITILTGRVGAIVSLVLSVGLGAFFSPMLGDLGHLRSVGVSTAIMTLFGGMIAYVAVLLREALEQLHARQAQEHVLLLELQHRVKNSLAVIQSIAAQTFKGADDVADKHRFTERLIALAEVHNLLSDQGWSNVSMRALAERCLAPFTPSDPRRFILAGDDVRVPQDLVVPLALSLHELATNAVKHGALSDDSGRVEIWWATSRSANGGIVDLVWSEQGGPPVLKPSRSGFGSRLLGRGLGGDGPARSSLEFKPEGVRWSASFQPARSKEEMPQKARAVLVVERAQ